MPTKIMRFQIIKPTNTDWKTLGKVLNQVQYDTRQIMNKSIQLAWEYTGFSSDYKEKFNEYPKSKEVLNYSSIHGYCYNILKDSYKNMYSGNLSQSIKRATDKWKTDTKDILKGDKSIPIFKKDIPIDIISDAMSINKEDKSYIITASLISTAFKKELDLKSGQFNLIVKVGDNTQKSIIERIINKKYKLSASQIIHKNNKWFINLSYTFEKEETELNKDLIMGIDLGIKYAAYYSISNTKKRGGIEGSEIDKFRKGTEKRKNQILHQGKYCADGRIGHGIKTRIKPIEFCEEKVSNFRATTNHKYSRYLVDIALKNKCAIIQMENLSRINNENKFLKNWSYYDLQQKIEYKAEEKGIEVKYINPAFTSQRCSACGHIDKENRKNQASFKCVKCEFEVNADYNASVNISTKDIEYIIKEKCKELNIEYHEKEEKLSK